ncbi:iron ABC transporter permease [Glycomyces sp. L485]|uniref:FecCD family ABC transporter permease n=1 Tax=Glycomyces sp. L485 TaxID=2909235 RepID=UPI001F4ACFB3|nr:iron ABC transporter permease [Glycomyces sp. L485]MCH7232012.1 iron ABC transporter permease [Glycomyces sp. L485]
MTSAEATAVPARAAIRKRALRGRIVVTALLALTAAVAAWALALGSSETTLLEVVGAVWGFGDSGQVFIVQQLRLPRVLTALLVGAALGASGTLMQGLMRNPLASPDVVGVTGGAGLAAVLAIGASVPPLGLPVAAAAGAATATGLLYLFSGRGGTAGSRLVLIGIGIHAVASAGIALVMSRLPVGRLGAAEVWLAGSLHARNWTHATAAAIGLAIALPAAYWLLRRLSVLELGDDLAIGAGVHVRHTRTALLAMSAVLAGIAVAVAGPIAFVALGAPHIARRIAGPTRAATLTTAVLVGSLLVLAADIIGQRLFAPTSLAAGVVTAALGAPYLLWLLHRTGKR